MSKLLEGFIDDGRGAPLPGIPAIVTRVDDGAIVTSGITGSDGRWAFSGLDDDDEHFVNLTDGLGNAIVRGPWSGETREIWVRDRLALPDTGLAVLPNGGNTTVGGLPLVLDPDPLNVLEWRPGGIFSAGAVGLTQAAADLLYEPIDTAYTKAESDARYEPFDSAYTKAEADARYTQGGITQTAADLRYEPLDSAYTKSEADARYEPLDSAYTKAEDDARFLQLTGGSVMTGLLGPTTTNTRDLGTTALRWRALYGMTADLSTSLTVATKPLVISPDAANIVEWRANGLYAAAGAVSDIWVNTTGDTMTGDLNMTANVLPTVTNVRDLGSTSLRWRKVWATDADWTNAPTVGGSPVMTQTAADARYVNVTGDSMSGGINFGALGGAAMLTNTSDNAYYIRSTPAGWNDVLFQRYQINALTLWDFTQGAALLNITQGAGNMTVRGSVTAASLSAATLTLTSALGVPLGSVGAPAIYFGTDTNTGLYSSADDRIGIITGGVLRQFLDQNGRVWINPVGFSPGFPAGYENHPSILVEHETTGHVNGLSLAKASSDVAAETLNIWKTRGTWASKAAVANADALTRFNAWAWSGANWLNVSAVQSLVSGTVTSTAVPTALQFLVADSAGALTERVRIQPDGLVGLGAKADGSAQATLDVQSSAAATSAGFIRGHASAANTQAWFRSLRGSDNLCILGANNLGWVADLLSATAIGTFATKRIPVYDSAGTLQGYIPLYS